MVIQPEEQKIVGQLGLHSGIQEDTQTTDVGKKLGGETKLAISSNISSGWSNTGESGEAWDT